MDYAVIISAIVLGLSVLATAAKFLDWFLHSDPKTMVRTIRWMLLLLVIVAIPLLVTMIVREQYAGAMLLGAAMIIVPTFLKWRAILVPLRAAFAQLRPKPKPFQMPPVWEEPARGSSPVDDPRAIAHAAALLEAYLKHATPMASSQRQISAPADDEDNDGMTRQGSARRPRPAGRRRPCQRAHHPSSSDAQRRSRCRRLALSRGEDRRSARCPGRRPATAGQTRRRRNAGTAAPAERLATASSRFS